jgi:hypothetical protein
MSEELRRALAPILWGKPLCQQSEEVQTAIRRIAESVGDDVDARKSAWYAEHGANRADGSANPLPYELAREYGLSLLIMPLIRQMNLGWKVVTAAEFFERLSCLLGNSEAGEYLNELGIPGQFPTEQQLSALRAKEW